MSLLRTGVQALKWSVLGELAARVLGPLTFIVLARILLPADFGVVAAATVLISLAQVLCELGLAKALVQRTDRVQEAATTAFWLNTGFGALLMGALFFAAPAVAAFFGEPRIELALQVLSPVMLLSALSAVPMALMQRHFRYKALFWVRLLGAGLPALASLPVALAGGGHWALVGGVLAGQAAQAAALWWLGGWRPRYAFSWELAGELMRFGRWALLSGLLGWGYGWMDAVVVGRFLGAHDMGVYRTGSMLVTLIFGLLFSPILPVLYGLFSRAQHDLPVLREALITVVRAVTLVALPIALLLYATSEQLAQHALGANWLGAGLVIGMLALTQGASWIVSFNGELHRAMGRPLAEVVALGPMLFVYLVVYLVTIQRGLEVFLWGRLVLAGVAIFVQIAVCWRVAQISPIRWARPLIALGACLCCAALVGVANEARSVAVSALIVTSFTCLLFVSERKLLLRLRRRWRDSSPTFRPVTEEAP